MGEQPETVRTLRRRLLGDPDDPGCGHVLAEVDRYAELAMTGSDPDRAFPGVTVHLRNCRACRADLVGLLEALHWFPPS